MKKTKKYIMIIICLLLLVAISLTALFFLEGGRKNDAPETVEPEPEKEVVLTPEQILWNKNHDINPDYVGELVFESGLVNQPFVQARTVYDENGDLRTFYTQDGRLVDSALGYTGNDVYIWTNWKTGEYDYNTEGGSVFMDCRSELDDQNIIIYGHHFSEHNDINREKAFTPLEKLLVEENYKENSKAYLILEDEKREYELWSVYEYDVTDFDDYEKAQYYRSSYNYDYYNNEYNDDYYSAYIEYIEKTREYDTDVKLTPEDNTLTLQTCISGFTGVKYEILVFRLTNTEKWLND